MPRFTWWERDVHLGASVDYVLPLISDAHLRHKRHRLLRDLSWLCFKPWSRAGAAIWHQSVGKDGRDLSAPHSLERNPKPSWDLWPLRSGCAGADGVGLAGQLILWMNYGNRQFLCSPIRSDLYYKVCAVIRSYSSVFSSTCSGRALEDARQPSVISFIESVCFPSCCSCTKSVLEHTFPNEKPGHTVLSDCGRPHRSQRVWISDLDIACFNRLK